MAADFGIKFYCKEIQIIIKMLKFAELFDKVICKYSKFYAMPLGLICSESLLQL